MEQEDNESPDERNGEEFEIIDIMEFLGNRDLEEDDNESTENSEEEYESAEDGKDIFDGYKNVTFDITLPSAHSYLSQDWDELSGHTLHEDGAVITIPILSFPGVVLMPGQLLPLHLFRNADIAMIKYCLDRDRTFGQLDILRSTNPAAEGYSHRLANVGTTVEILAFKEEETMDMKVKTVGRQRFEVMDKRSDVGGNILATVRILPDKSLPEPLVVLNYPSRAAYLHYESQDYDKTNEEISVTYNNGEFKLENSNLRDDYETLNRNDRYNDADDKEEDDVSEIKIKNDNIYIENENKATKDHYNTITKITSKKKPFLYSTAWMTHWPEWVYNQYNCRVLMADIKKEMEAWNDKMVSSKVPIDPESFSFWVASCLPLDDNMRVELLRMDSCQQRLRFELFHIKKCTIMCCSSCKQMVAKKQDVFSMSSVGPLGAYVNPGGHVHETLTVHHATGLHHIGKPSTEASWFPGYAWTIVQCNNCHKHMGWRFTVATKDPSVQPQKFWGLCRTALVPGLIDCDLEDSQEAFTLPT